MVKMRAAAALWGCVLVGAFAGVFAITAGRAATAAGTSGSAPAPSAYEETLARAGARLAAEAESPQAIAALAELAALDEEVAPAALEAAVRRGVAPGAHPLVAAQAAFLLAHLDDERGANNEAAALRGGLGFLAHPLVIGPFGEGRASFGTAFPPEAERAAPEPGRSYPGKARDVAWRAGDTAVREGGLYLDGLLRPDDQAVAYVAAFVHSDRERAAALRLGSPGPIKVWVNGALVFAHDVVRPAALDQDAAGIRLGRGWNRILIKTVVVDGAWRLYARLTEPSGAPLAPLGPLFRANEPETPPAHAKWVSSPARPAKAPAVASIDLLLERRAQAARGAGAAEAWLDLARCLAWIAPRDRDAHAAADAAERSLAVRPSPEAYLVAAEIADSDDARRRDLERAFDQAISPAWRALLLARLGELARTERREARATESFRQALTIDPGCWPAALALADDESEAALPLAAVAGSRRCQPPSGRCRGSAVRRRASMKRPAAGARAIASWRRWRTSAARRSICCTSSPSAPARAAMAGRPARGSPPRRRCGRTCRR